MVVSIQQWMATAHSTCSSSMAVKKRKAETGASFDTSIAPFSFAAVVKKAGVLYAFFTPPGYMAAPAMFPKQVTIKIQHQTLKRFSLGEHKWMIYTHIHTDSTICKH